jgi:hypothetical protein
MSLSHTVSTNTVKIFSKLYDCDCTSTSTLIFSIFVDINNLYYTIAPSYLYAMSLKIPFNTLISFDLWCRT